MSTLTPSLPATAADLSPAPGRLHLNYLDGVRGLAGLFVVLHHIWLHVFMRDPAASLAKRITGIFYFGHYAVDVFIALSGFCLMLPVIRRDGNLAGGAVNFFKKRAHRILPPYYAMMAVSWLIPWLMTGGHDTGWAGGYHLSAKGIIAHLLLVQDAFKDAWLPNGVSMWSVAVEWQIYFLFPLLVFRWQRVGSLRATGLFALGSFALLALLFPFHNYINLTVTGLCPQYLALFACGALGAGVAFSSHPDMERIRRALPLVPTFLALTGLIVVLSEVKLLHGRPLPMQITDFVVGVWASFLLVAAAPGIGQETAAGQRLRALLGWKPLVFLGTFAYSTFLFHVPLLPIVWKYLQPLLPPSPAGQFALLCVFGVPSLLGITYLFYLVCERPFLNTRPQTARLIPCGVPDGSPL